ncbi:MAG: YihY/virulence factor BrkB family protein [bacterium]
MQKTKKPGPAVLSARVWNGMQKNYSYDMAAELGFYFFYSLFPFLIFVVAITAWLPISATPAGVLAMMKEFLPDYLFTLAGPAVVDIIFRPRTLLAAGTLILALWAASSAVSSLMTALNRIHCVEEHRSYWKAKGISLLLTAALAGVLLAAFFLLVLGPVIKDWLTLRVGFAPVFKMLFGASRWVIAVTVMLFDLALVFSFGPGIKRPFRLFSPGALVTLAGWFGFSELFRLYIQSAGPHNLFYGAAGGIIGLMTWLYLMGLMMLAGAQVNHELGRD